ncbi:MAG: hypothetical protein SFV19_15980 [Rhodospirillaceae bacterium]|nr:hypothetical protein [Rhodospirillaceae bacterium]
MTNLLKPLVLGLGVLAALPATADDNLSPSEISALLSTPRVGGDVVIAKDVKQILAFGGRVSVKDSTADTIAGAAGEIMVENSKLGKVYVAAGTLDVTGGSTGDFRAAAGKINLTTNVSGDLELAGGQVTLNAPMNVSGDATLRAGSVVMSGNYGGDTEIEAETASLAGTYGGDVWVMARKISIASGTTIGGNLKAPNLSALPEGVTVAGKTAIGTAAGMTQSIERDGVKVTIDMDDKVDSAIKDAMKNADKEDRGSGLISPEPMGMSAWFTVLATLAVCGALALAVAPQFVARAAERVSKDPLASLGVGLGSLVAVPVVLALVGMTIIGIPLAVLGAAAYAIGMGLGLIALCLWAGLMVRTLANQPGQETRLAKLVGWTLMGFLALALVGAIPIVGRWIQILAVMTGAGAALSTAWAARKASKAATAA